jgi:hypothetical protein
VLGSRVREPGCGFFFFDYSYGNCYKFWPIDSGIVGVGLRPTPTKKEKIFAKSIIGPYQAAAQGGYDRLAALSHSGADKGERKILTVSGS